jgi:microcystin degradation protein MlrC
MVPRAFIAALAQETNSFAPLPTGLCDFDGRFRGAGTERDTVPPFPEAVRSAGRALHAAGRVILLDGPAAGANPSGPVVQSAFETLRDAILFELRETGPVDIVALQLHGAMIATDCRDCEGDLLRRVREVVGEAALVGALIDPHAHLSRAMVEASDIIIAYKEYPHTDFQARADELWHCLLEAHERRFRPTAALWDSGTIGIFHSSLPRVRKLIDSMVRSEREDGLASVSLIHGFPWGDCEDLGTRALVYSDGDFELADRVAKDLAGEARQMARDVMPRTVPLEAALERVRSHLPGSGPLILADSPDNPGGGAAGDATFVLQALLEAELGEVALGPLWDPMAARVAASAGTGAEITLRLGGKSGPLSGIPLDLRVRVLAVEEDGFQTFAGERFELGLTASVSCRGVCIVIASRRDQARGPDLFSRMAIEPGAKRAIVVKSSQHFRAGFDAIAADTLYLDVPGTLQLDLSALPYRHVRRPRGLIDEIGAVPWRVIENKKPGADTNAA